MRKAILHDGEVPYELVIERICQKYHKLPSEVLAEDWDWIERLIDIANIDAEKLKKEENLNKVKQQIQQNGTR